MKMLESTNQDVARTAATMHTYLERSIALPAALMRHARLPSISLLLGTAGPGMAHEDLAVVGDFINFIFAVDDLVDEGDLDLGEIEERLACYAACAAGESRPQVALDPMALYLCSLAERLRRAPLGSVLWPLWTQRIHEMLGAMVAERRASEVFPSSGELPDLERYLATGRHSIGVAASVMIAWMLLGETGIDAALLAAEEALSRAVRIANDLRSDERERDEGKVNAVVIAGEHGKAGLRHRMSVELERGHALLAGSRNTRSADFLGRFASFMVDLYSKHDFHSSPSAAMFLEAVAPPHVA